MATVWRSRWDYLHDTQLRKSRGIGVLAIGGIYGIGQGYDFFVGQFAKDPNTWWRARDVIGFLSWEQWVIVGLIVVAALLFEGGYRASRTRDIAIGQLQGDSATQTPRLSVTVDPRLQETHFGFEDDHAKSAYLEVTNTSDVPLADVEVRVCSMNTVVPKHDNPCAYVLTDFLGWVPAVVFWSKKEQDP